MVDVYSLLWWTFIALEERRFHPFPVGFS